MSTSASASQATISAQAGDYWRRLAPRERWAMIGAGALLLLTLVWLLLVGPALRTLREAPAVLDRLDAQLQQMQRLSNEARELKATPPVSASQSVNALRAASERLGEHARFNAQGDRATLTLTGITSEKLRQWLAEARSGARARIVDAQLSRGPQGFSGSIVVSFGGSS